MKQFNGFPPKMEYTPVPNLFFSALLTEIDNIAELKTTLYVLAALYRKRGYPRFVTFNELRGNAGLMSNFGAATRLAENMLRGALKMAVERGTILQVVLEEDGTPEDIYFLNTESDRQLAAKVQSGEFRLSGMKAPGSIPVETEPLPDIFTLYEQNIGILTPMIAEELKEAEKLYPESWIKDAVKEAVNQNKRKWSYISAILKDWAAEGKSDGTHRRYSKADPDKYIKGKYGHMVQR